METARIGVSLPFRAEGPAEEHVGCRKTFDSRDMDRFLTALYREIHEASADCDDLLVREIVFGNGSAAHFTADDLMRMVSEIKKQFHVSPQAVIRFTVTPAGFDFYKLSAIRQMRGSVCFELPALTDEGLQAGEYHCTAEQAAAALECCFQNGFRQFSVYLTARSMKEKEAEETLKRLLAMHPEAIRLRKDAADPFTDTVNRILEAEGWTRRDHCWTCEAIPDPAPCSVQIGCGPNAVSVFENTALRSTADFEYYCEHADDFEALVRQAEQDSI